MREMERKENKVSLEIDVKIKGKRYERAGVGIQEVENEEQDN